MDKQKHVVSIPCPTPYEDEDNDDGCMTVKKYLLWLYVFIVHSQLIQLASQPSDLSLLSSLIFNNFNQKEAIHKKYFRSYYTFNFLKSHSVFN